MIKKTKENEDVVIGALLGALDDLDFNGPDDSGLWQDQYPFVQWNNREKSWEFPLKHWAGSRIENEYDLTEVDHGEDTEHGFLLETIHLSVIAWRYTWETPGSDGRMVYSLKPNFDDGQNWSKRYNFLCLVRETGDDDPAIVTAKGYTGEFLYNALNQGRKRTLKLARKLTGKQFPGYLFWTPLAAGGKRVVGKDKKSPIYPPAPVAYDIAEIDDEGQYNLLASLYIGDQFKNVIVDYLYDEGQRWMIDTPSRMVLTDGRTNSAEATADILSDGSLWLPDLSEHKRSDWIDLAMTIPELFSNRNHASNAFSKVLRSLGLASAAPGDQWEAWRTDLERRWAEKMEDNEVMALEAQLRNGG